MDTDFGNEELLKKKETVDPFVILRRKDGSDVTKNLFDLPSGTAVTVRRMNGDTVNAIWDGEKFEPPEKYKALHPLRRGPRDDQDTCEKPTRESNQHSGSTYDRALKITHEKSILYESNVPGASSSATSISSTEGKDYDRHRKGEDFTDERDAGARRDLSSPTKLRTDLPENSTDVAPVVQPVRMAAIKLSVVDKVHTETCLHQCRFCKKLFNNFDLAVQHLEHHNNLDYWFGCLHCPLIVRRKRLIIIAHVKDQHPQHLQSPSRDNFGFLNFDHYFELVRMQYPQPHELQGGKRTSAQRIPEEEDVILVSVQPGKRGRRDNSILPQMTKMAVAPWASVGSPAISAQGPTITAARMTSRDKSSVHSATYGPPPIVIMPVERESATFRPGSLFRGPRHPTDVKYGPSVVMDQNLDRRPPPHFPYGVPTTVPEPIVIVPIAGDSATSTRSLFSYPSHPTALTYGPSEVTDQNLAPRPPPHYPYCAPTHATYFCDVGKK